MTNQISDQITWDDFARDDGAVVLCVPEKDVPLGAKLG